jgi:hypothetical protein
MKFLSSERASTLVTLTNWSAASKSYRYDFMWYLFLPALVVKVRVELKTGLGINHLLNGHEMLKVLGVSVDEVGHLFHRECSS